MTVILTDQELPKSSCLWQRVQPQGRPVAHREWPRAPREDRWAVRSGYCRAPTCGRGAEGEFQLALPSWPFCIMDICCVPSPHLQGSLHTYRCSVRGVSVVELELIWERRWPTRSRTSVPRKESYWGRGKTSTDRQWIRVLILCRFQRH